MIKIEKKIIKNKPFFYLTEQVNIGTGFKKIQVYIGKNIPKNLSDYYAELEKKEIALVCDNLSNIFKLGLKLSIDEYKKIETIRIKLKYILLLISKFRQEQFWRDFAVKFIFESNAIEGSKLSQEEVKAIIKKQYIKKSIERKEIIEVNNSIKAFAIIRSGKFTLNQRTVINLHELLTKNLDINRGYKKSKIIINNKETVPPGEVRNNMANLLKWWSKQKKDKLHPFIIASIFHQRFEHIHPFSDGNGRTGRLLFIWMLFKTGYGAILFKNRNRLAYFSALDQADNGRPGKLYRHCLLAYKRTYQDIKELYC